MPLKSCKKHQKNTSGFCCLGLPLSSEKSLSKFPLLQLGAVLLSSIWCVKAQAGWVTLSLSEIAPLTLKCLCI